MVSSKWTPPYMLGLLSLLLYLFTATTHSMAVDKQGWRISNPSLTTTSDASSGIQVEIGPVSSTSSQPLNEMLVPLQSTTALICEPVFNQQMSGKSAFWYKNGKKVAEVTGHSNAVLGERTMQPAGSGVPSQEQFPQVGFLIITDVTLEDEGDYWCAKQENPNQPGEKTRLKIAFLRPFSLEEQEMKVIVSGTLHNPKSSISSGEMLVLECPPTQAVPPPTIHWMFNKEPVDFAGGSSQMEVLANGSLLIQHYSHQHAGFYTCEMVNFAGRTSASISLLAPVRNKEAAKKGYSLAFCTAYLRSGILWFLIGCVTTCCVVLVYLLAGMLCYRYSHNRRSRSPPAAALPAPTTCRTSSQQPTTCWKQCCWLLKVVADPSASPPGFRKPVAPVADRLIRSTSSTEPILPLQANQENVD